MKSERDEEDRLGRRKDSEAWSAFVTTTKLVGERKQKFVQEFIEAKMLETFPFDHDDVVADTISVVPIGTIEHQACYQIRDVFKRFNVSDASAPPSMAVVLDLLDSFDEHRVSMLRNLPLADINVDRVLAHLLSLGFELSPRVSASIARRMTELLLNEASNRGRKPVKTGADPSYDLDERAAILEFDAHLPREEAERLAKDGGGG